MGEVGLPAQALFNERRSALIKGDRSPLRRNPQGTQADLSLDRLVSQEASMREELLAETNEAASEIAALRKVLSLEEAGDGCQAISVRISAELQAEQHESAVLRAHLEDS